MRVTREKAAGNRDRIVASAATQFRQKGFDGVGLDAIMAEAGMTHGGFYRHFGSKDDLVAEAVAHGMSGSDARQAALGSLSALVAAYLSPEHRDDPGHGCVIAALGCDMARQGKAARGRFTCYVRAQFDRLAGWLVGRAPAERRRQAIATMAGLVGAVVLARAVDDPALSDEILAAAREAFGGA
jgi:TetR/AcrR family transcriptional repressor of nem operon